MRETRLLLSAAVGFGLLVGGTACRRQASAPEPAETTTAEPAAGTEAPAVRPTPDEDAALPGTGPRPLANRALRNLGLDLEGVTVKLESGFQETPGHIYRLLDPIVRGDLDGDGVPDSTFLLEDQVKGAGGERLRHLVAVLNRDGQPELAGSQLVGNRSQLRSLRVREGGIQLEIAERQLNDPPCCPTGRVERRYRVVAGGLVQE